MLGIKSKKFIHAGTHSDFSTNCIRPAFTLAEVLITLGIIGVVAAMTLPTVVNKYQDKVTVTKLKKVYNILSQSYLSAVAEYGKPSEWGIAGRDASNTEDDVYLPSNALLLKNRLFKNMNKIASCDDAKNKNLCGFAEKYLYTTGVQDTYLTGNSAGAVAVGLIDGSSIAIAANGSNASGENRGNGKLEKTFAYIYVDVNNSNGPNVWGKIYLDFI